MPNTPDTKDRYVNATQICQKCGLTGETVCDRCQVGNAPTVTRENVALHLTDPNDLTNGEAIRSWDNDNLGEFIEAVHLGLSTPWCNHSCENHGDKRCLPCIVKWLNQKGE